MSELSSASAPVAPGDEHVTKAHEGFWKRQFNAEVTPSQVRFDVVFGIVLPIVCVAVDPCVLKKTWDHLPLGILIPPWLTLFCYAEILIGVVSMTMVLWTRRNSVTLAGCCFGGALFAFTLGLLLLPLSLLGLAIGIGVLGFTPFLTCFTLRRNGIRILKRRPEGAAREFATVWAVVVAAAALLAPAFAQWSLNQIINSQIQLIVSGTDEQREAAVEELKRIRYFTNYDALAWAYYWTQDEGAQYKLELAYRALTGEDIGWRSVVLSD